MTAVSYHTISAPTEGLYKEKGSKFLAFAYPVQSEEEIRDHLQKLKKTYFDARHHCYAWMLGPDKKHFRANDDGEPNHSAGDPILGQIRSRNITNVLVVVVRYFGGVKLGVGGLITAYKMAAEDALSKANIVEREVESLLRFDFDYNHTPDVMRLIKEFDLRLLRQDFQEACTMEIIVHLRHQARLMEKITLLNALGIRLKATLLT